MSSSVLPSARTELFNPIHETRFNGLTRPFNCNRSKCVMNRRSFAFRGVAAAGLSVMGSSLTAQPVQGVERLEFKPEGYNFWTWRGHKIHYVVQGEGPPVVLIHGFGASAFHWRYNIPELAKKYKVYAIDLLGFGWSEKALIDYDAMVWRDQVEDFLKEIVKEPTVLVGNSLGGFTALVAAAGLPEQVVGVALLNSAGQFGNPNSVAKESEEETALQKFILKPLKEVFQRVVLGFLFWQAKQPARVESVLKSVYKNTANAVGQRVSLQLISAVRADDSENGLKGKLGKPAYLEDWITTITPLTAGESAFKVTFDYEEEVGVPGAFLIKNNHHSEFFLKTVTLENVPGEGRVHFVCNSWVYPTEKYTKDRVFFVNKTYLPSETPLPLRKYREEELVHLRGDGKGELQEWERVYDYAYYNDLGKPDKGAKYVRPVLGGSSEYPYPRRGRTGRPPTKTDPNSESSLPLIQSLDIYVPRDERFGHLKLSDFLIYALKSIAQFIKPELESLFDQTPSEFDSFEDVLKLYKGGIPLPEGLLKDIGDNIPAEMLKEIFRTDGAQLLKFPTPQVIKEDKSAWRTDEEFAREMLAGVNPVNIARLQVFPPASKLDPKVYGDQNSTITEEHIKNNLDGLTVDEALKKNKLFILDHHDSLMPYLRRINSTSNKIYGSRTLLFLQNDGTLKPLVIELSLPHPDGDQFGCISNVYTPAEQGVEGSIWQLAKAYVAVNDSGVHQLISHWLNTHAVSEPVVIATNRQLSVVHPIYKLLHPHFRDTMNINAFARQILINAGGILETTVFPARYAMELSSVVYKDWNFTEQALPADLIKRGVAVKDKNSPHGLRLLIEDYPYAVDGIEIWFAIRTWVADYCSFYYKTDDIIQKDAELQSWWKELVEEGHGDKKDEPWWPKLQTLEELVEICTTIIWTASALHAAVNFGQYPYAGYLPNRPTISRKFMPVKGTAEYEELKSNPDKVFLKTITAQLQTLLGISLIEILSRHSTDEVYLGQRDTPEWTADAAPLEAFDKFGKKLEEIEERITSMNNDEKLKNRVGPVKVPYTLLFPTSGGGLTGKGIPNSVSI